MSRLEQALRASGTFYPERGNVDETALERFFVSLWGRLTHPILALPSRLRPIVRHVERAEADIRELAEDQLLSRATELRGLLREKGFTPALVGRSFALIRELSSRLLGERHYDVQLMGGYALLRGMIAEMATGEGKTLTATLPAGTVALAGIPVHVITVNDYLARRDAEWMGPIFSAMGLSVGVVTQETSPEDRIRAFRCDITYLTNKDLVFDYLRDRLVLGQKPGPLRMRLERLYDRRARIDRLRMRGLVFGIVDEADSVLIDEARTPVIISGPGEASHEADMYRTALELAARLETPAHFQLEAALRQVTLTDAGKARLTELCTPLGGIWSGRLRREDLVAKALTVLLLYQRDKHYVVTAGKVHIVDEYTGRLMPGRFWEGGIHQLVESKEGCEITVPTEVLAKISYQRFFRRYVALAGMTGTAKEATHELWSVYGLRVVSIPTAKPMIRRGLPTRIHRTQAHKWDAVVARIREVRSQGRPILVGTRTVLDSQHLAGLLAKAGIPCRVLNALQDAEEAAIVAIAGQRDSVTVATNMAGRGTDIKLGPGVRELGGIHVLACELHDAGRIDRQLFGRCGRQGDAGSYEAFVSLEDDVLKTHPGRIVGPILRAWSARNLDVGPWLGGWMFRRAQRTAERVHARMRGDLLKLDEIVDSSLAFSGTRE